MIMLAAFLSWLGRALTRFSDTYGWGLFFVMSVYGYERITCTNIFFNIQHT